MSPKESKDSGEEAASGAAGRDAVRKALSKARSTVRLQGEVVHREGGGVAIRRGGSVFEVEAKDIVEVRELQGGSAEVLFKPDAQLIRSTVLESRWAGSAIGWRPVFDDCGDCTECSVCADCTECSVCADCTECSVCVGTECSVCADCTECSVCADCTECSVCVGTECSVCLDGFGGLEGGLARGVLSAWIRSLGGGGAGRFVRRTRRRLRSR